MKLLKKSVKPPVNLSWCLELAQRLCVFSEKLLIDLKSLRSVFWLIEVRWIVHEKTCILLENEALLLTEKRKKRDELLALLLYHLCQVKFVHDYLFWSFPRFSVPLSLWIEASTKPYQTWAAQARYLLLLVPVPVKFLLPCETSLFTPWLLRYLTKKSSH